MTANNAGQLSVALQSASSGTCIVLGSGTYSGNFAISTRIQMIGAGSSVLSGTSSLAAALEIDNTDGVRIMNLTIRGPGHGVVAKNSNHLRLDDIFVDSVARIGAYFGNTTVRATGLRIVGAGSAGCAIVCDDGVSLCRDRLMPSIFDRIELDANARVGMYVSGAAVQLDGGSILNTQLTSVGTGVGLAMLNGARGTLGGTRISGNGQPSQFDGTGVVIDGALTRVVLDAVSVVDNRGRGIWAQNLRGLIMSVHGQSDPAMTISGRTRISGNALVGVGATNSVGMLLLDATISDTRPVPKINLGVTNQVGDGAGFFGNSGAIVLEGATFSNNARAQAVVSSPSELVRFTSSRSSVPSGMYGDSVVVQSNTASVTVDTGGLSVVVPTAPLHIVQDASTVGQAGGVMILGPGAGGP